MIDQKYYDSVKSSLQLASFLEDEKRENQARIINWHINIAGQVISDLFKENELLKKQINELTKETNETTRNK